MSKPAVPTWYKKLRPVGRQFVDEHEVASRVAVAFVYGTDIIAVDGACLARFGVGRVMVYDKDAVPPETPVRDLRSSSGALETTFGELGDLELMSSPDALGVGLPGLEVSAAIVSAYRSEITAIVRSDVFYSCGAPKRVFDLGEQIIGRLFECGRGRGNTMWYDESDTESDSSGTESDESDTESDSERAVVDPDHAAKAAAEEAAKAAAEEAAKAAARKAREPPPSEIDVLAGERIAAVIAAPVRAMWPARAVARDAAALPEGLNAETDSAFSLLSDRERARVLAAGARIQGGIRAAFAEFVAARPGVIRRFLGSGHGCAVDRAAVARAVAAFTSKLRRRSWEQMAATAPHPDSFDADILGIIRSKATLWGADRGSPAGPIVENVICAGDGNAPEVAICNAIYSGDANVAEVAATFLPQCMRETPLGAENLEALCEFTGRVLPHLDLSQTSLTGSAVALIADPYRLPPGLVRLRASAYTARPLGPAPGEWLAYSEIVDDHCWFVSVLVRDITRNDVRVALPVSADLAVLIERARQVYRSIRSGHGGPTDRRELNAIVTTILDRALWIENGVLVSHHSRRAQLAEREGADVDLAVAAVDNGEFDRIAAAHVSTIRRQYPGATAQRVEQGGDRHKWVVTTTVRNFEIYRASLDRVVTHHVAPARAAYTAQPLPGATAPPGPRLLVSSTYANTCFPENYTSREKNRGLLREIRSWASRRTSPLEIIAKYGARGFVTNSGWARLIAETAYAPDARHLHAVAALAAIRTLAAQRRHADTIAIMCDAFAAPVRGADTYMYARAVTRTDTCTTPAL